MLKDSIEFMKNTLEIYQPKNEDEAHVYKFLKKNSSTIKKLFNEFYNEQEYIVAKVGADNYRTEEPSYFNTLANINELLLGCVCELFGKTKL